MAAYFARGHYSGLKYSIVAICGGFYYHTLAGYDTPMQEKSLQTLGLQA